MTEEEYNIWACDLDGIGIKKITALFEHFGSCRSVFNASEKQLCDVTGISQKDAHIIVKNRRNYRTKPWKDKLNEFNMRCVTFFSEGYPVKLKNIHTPPKRLFFCGTLPNEKVQIAIVGARTCSFYGRETARDFAYELAKSGVGIISGMARGIDGWAHQGALEAGKKTYAVLGNSAEICYPREHSRLYESIRKNGGILSEYPPQTEAMPGFFPMRNRIISALADGIVVVEARKKSGSLITADQALEQGKDVFVIPGRVGDQLSEGCNNLIKQGAFLVTSPEEIMDYYGVIVNKKQENIAKKNIFLERKDKMVYASLSLEPKHLNVLAFELKSSQVEVLKSILSLQKLGLIKNIGNHYYIKNGS